MSGFDPKQTLPTRLFQSKRREASRVRNDRNVRADTALRRYAARHLGVHQEGEGVPPAAEELDEIAQGQAHIARRVPLVLNIEVLSRSDFELVTLYKQI
jgi:hypothetical protein